MTSKGPVDLTGMDRSFFEALSPGRTAVPSSCAGDRAGGEAGPGFDQLVAPAILRWSLRPSIRASEQHCPAVRRATGTGTAVPLRAQTRQAARQQRDLAVRGSASRVL